MAKETMTKDLRKFLAMLRWMRPYIKDSYGMLIMVVIGTLITSGMTAAYLQILRHVLDHLTTSHDSRYLWGAMAFFAVVTLVRGVGDYCRSNYVARIHHRMETKIKRDLFKQYQTLSLDFYQKHNSGALMAKLISETDVVLQAVDIISTVLQTLATITALFLTALSMNFHYTLLAVLISPILFFFLRSSLDKVRAVAKDVPLAHGALQQRVLEHIQSARIVRVYQAESTELRKFDSALERVLNNAEQVARQSNMSSVQRAVLQMAGTALIFYLVGSDVLAGKTTLGQMVTFIMSIVALYVPISHLIHFHIRLVRISAMAEGIIPIFRMKPTVQDAGTHAFPTDAREIVFKNVSFSYPQGNRGPVLQDATFTVKKGEVVAILGPNGGGKSTLLNLLPRLYDPTGGSIEINGVDIRQFSLNSLRSHIAMVAQDMSLFEDTIYNNILLGKMTASREEVEKASRLSFAHEFIVQLPQGYDTPVGERGTQLSEGQKQRIAIARAFLREASILILDEPSSALDSAARDAVTGALRNLMADRFVFLITHQLSFLPPDARKLYLQGGKLLPEPTLALASQGA